MQALCSCRPLPSQLTAQYISVDISLTFDVSWLFSDVSSTIHQLTSAWLLMSVVYCQLAIVDSTIYQLKSAWLLMSVDYRQLAIDVSNTIHQLTSAWLLMSVDYCQLAIDFSNTIHQVTSAWLKHWYQPRKNCQLISSGIKFYISRRKSCRNAFTSCLPTSSWHTQSSPSCASPH